LENKTIEGNCIFTTGPKKEGNAGIGYQQNKNRNKEGIKTVNVGSVKIVLNLVLSVLDNPCGWLAEMWHMADQEQCPRVHECAPSSKLVISNAPFPIQNDLSVSQQHLSYVWAGDPASLTHHLNTKCGRNVDCRRDRSNACCWVFGFSCIGFHANFDDDKSG
jgi:hypothetical protein